MHHPAAQDFQPVLALPDLHLAAGAVAAHVHLRRRLGEGEVMGAEAGGHPVGLEEPGDEGLQGPLQVAHVDALVDHQALDLVEHGRVGLVGILAEGAARHDHPDRRLLAPGDPRGRLLVRLVHDPHLDRRGVGAQDLALAVGVRRQEEGVVHFPRRVLGREVQGCEVVEVGLDVGPFGDGEAHVGEDGDQFVHHLHGRVHAALPAGRGGQGQVHPLGRQAGLQFSGLQLGLAGLDPGGQAVAHLVDLGPQDLPLLKAYRAEGPGQKGDVARLAQDGDARLVQGRQVGGSVDPGQVRAFQFGDVGHARRSAAGGLQWEGRKQKAPRARRGASDCSRAEGSGRQARAARTLSAMALKPTGSLPAMSASTLRSIWTPASSRPWINRA